MACERNQMTTLPKALIEFHAKYGFWPKRELARVYWNIGQRLSNDPAQCLQALIAYSHAMRLWPEIINAR